MFFGLKIRNFYYIFFKNYLNLCCLQSAMPCQAVLRPASTD